MGWQIIKRGFKMTFRTKVILILFVIINGICFSISARDAIENMVARAQKWESGMRNTLFGKLSDGEQYDQLAMSDNPLVYPARGKALNDINIPWYENPKEIAEGYRNYSRTTHDKNVAEKDRYYCFLYK